DTTISGKKAVGGPGTIGGGIFSTSSGAEPALINSIVANNTSGDTSPDLGGDDIFGLGFTLVRNLSGASTSTSVPSSNLLGVDPQLGPLAANGGPTSTLRPAFSSPVLDKGGDTGAPTTDQRGSGFPRAFDVP